MYGSRSDTKAVVVTTLVDISCRHQWRAAYLCALSAVSPEQAIAAEFGELEHQNPLSGFLKDRKTLQGCDCKTLKTDIRSP